MLLALIHVGFPNHFKWKTELASLSIMNRQMMYVHSFFIALVVFLMGLLSFTSYEELIGTPFGKKISLGIGFFWVIRMAVQFFVYSPKLWKGKTVETIVHVFFSLFWIYTSLVFILISF